MGATHTSQAYTSIVIFAMRATHTRPALAHRRSDQLDADQLAEAQVDKETQKRKLAELKMEDREPVAALPCY